MGKKLRSVDWLIIQVLLKTIVLEFPGIVADYLLLNAMVLHGEKLIEKVDMMPEDWQKTYLSLKLITELDPRFLDPYLMAETSLPWEAGMVEETNQMLLKAATVLPDDYRPYFYLWFNNYYFLHDLNKAGIYLEKAARIPGSPKYYKTLAARMHLESGHTISGIIFLQEMIQETRDQNTRLFLQKRLDVLKTIALLEKNVDDYAKRYQQWPAKLSDLVSEGFIEEIPQDPYGGSFYIMPNGRVYTTSKLVQQKKKK